MKIILSLTGLLILSSCTTTREPVITTDQIFSQATMNRQKAEFTIRKLLMEAEKPPLTRAPRITQTEFLPTHVFARVEMDDKLGEDIFDCSVMFDRFDKLFIYTPNNESYAINPDVIQDKGYDNFGCFWYWPTRQKALEFASALVSLKTHSQSAVDPSTALRDFEQVAAAWKDPSSLSLPEEARRHKAVAEMSFNELRFEDALESYEKALQAAPWWAELYYNRALILGELGSYREAVTEMKKYAYLRPNSASSVEDKIFAWESRF